MFYDFGYLKGNIDRLHIQVLYFVFIKFYLSLCLQWFLVYFSRTLTKMSKPKKNSTLFDSKVDNKLCFNCGFPNREADRHCMYCKTSLLEDGFFSWIRETYYILIWRWQLNRKRDHLNVFLKPRLSFLKTIGFLL